MKLYKPTNVSVRVIITDENTGNIDTSSIKFSIEGATCEEVCALICETFPDNILPTKMGARAICKSRSIKIDVSLLDRSGTKMIKINRTINLDSVNSKEVSEQLINAVNLSEENDILSTAKKIRNERS